MSRINFFATHAQASSISDADGFSWDDTVGSRVKKEFKHGVDSFNRTMADHNASIERIASEIDYLFSTTIRNAIN